jgi:hypothetical protein
VQQYLLKASMTIKHKSDRIVQVEQLNGVDVIPMQSIPPPSHSYWLSSLEARPCKEETRVRTSLSLAIGGLS